MRRSGGGKDSVCAPEPRVGDVDKGSDCAKRLLAKGKEQWERYSYNSSPAAFLKVRK